MPTAPGLLALLERQDGLVTSAQAARHGLPSRTLRHRCRSDGPSQIVVTAPRRSGLRGYPGVRVRRRDLHPEDVVRSHGLRLTSRALTALETAAAVPDGAAVLDRALQRHVCFAEVHAAYCRNLGAHGGVRIAELLTAAADRHKGNALVRAGWTLLRFTWHDLTARPDYVIAQVQALLAATRRA